MVERFPLSFGNGCEKSAADEVGHIPPVDSENLSALPRDTVSPHHEVALQLGYDSHEKKQHLQVLAMMPRKAHKNLR